MKLRGNLDQVNRNERDLLCHCEYSEQRTERDLFQRNFGGRYITQGEEGNEGEHM